MRKSQKRSRDNVDMSGVEPRFSGEVSERSHKNMSSIKGKDTSIEIILRKALWARGYHFRKNYKDLPGRPDIAITKYKIAIFCDSEFFHGFDWENRKNDIKSNRDFWINKIERNIQRDKEVTSTLEQQGWTVLRFWGREIKRDLAKCADQIEAVLLRR